MSSPICKAFVVTIGFVNIVGLCYICSRGYIEDTHSVILFCGQRERVCVFLWGCKRQRGVELYCTFRVGRESECCLSLSSRLCFYGAECLAVVRQFSVYVPTTAPTHSLYMRSMEAAAHPLHAFRLQRAAESCHHAALCKCSIKDTQPPSTNCLFV